MYHFGINLQVSITNPQFASAIAGVTIVHAYIYSDRKWDSDNSWDSGTTVGTVGQQSGQRDNSRDSGTTVGRVFSKEYCLQFVKEIK